MEEGEEAVTEAGASREVVDGRECRVQVRRAIPADEVSGRMVLRGETVVLASRWELASDVGSC